MRGLLSVLVLLVVPGPSSVASSLGAAAGSVIPSEVQQIINVDYRRMKTSDSAMAMQTRLLPANMKQLTDALKGVGITPDEDLDQLTMVSFRTKEHALQTLGIAQGKFLRKKIQAHILKENFTGKKMNGSLVYSTAGGMNMTFLDDSTMLLGQEKAVQSALDVRDNPAQSLNSNSEITDMLPSVEAATIWSVQDANGTQAMVKAMLAAASELSEYESVRKQLLGSRYTMNFDGGVDFYLTVATSDAVTASTLSTLLKAGILFRKMGAEPPEKQALDNTAVDSDNTRLTVHFKADDKSFQQMLDSPMFAAVTH